MAITVEEKLEQQLGKDSGGLEYVIRGTTDAGDARTALLAGSSSTWNGKVRDETRVQEIPGFEGFLGFVSYKTSVTNIVPETGDDFLRITTTGGTAHILTSKATSRFPNTAQTPVFNGINVSGDGKIAGVDVIDKNFTFDVIAYHTNAQVTDAYLGTLFALSTTVNIAKVDVTAGTRTLTFDAGELLFIGADVADRNGDDWEVIYHFSAKPNVSGLTIGGIPSVEYKGHEYIWTYHEEEDDATAKKTIPTIRGVYVEQLYDIKALSGLLVVSVYVEPDP